MNEGIPPTNRYANRNNAKQERGHRVPVELRQGSRGDTEVRTQVGVMSTA